MSLESALRHVASSPEAPQDLATYRCQQIEGDEPYRVLVEEEHVAPVEYIASAYVVPHVRRRRYFVEPMHKVVDEGGVWWSVGWSVEARYVVFWRLGYQADPLAPRWNPYKGG